MAFKFSSKHIQKISLENLSVEQFLVIALETASKLDWNVGLISENGFIAYTKFSFKSYSEEVIVRIIDRTAIIKSECTGTQIVDWGKNKENISKFITTFNEVKGLLSEEYLANKYENLKPHLVSEQENVLDQGPITLKEKIVDIFSIFIPKKGYFITPILININIAVFIIMAISGVSIFMPDNESLISWGANFRPVTLEGEWWRLFTCCFLHIGVLHLLMNIYALLYIGSLLEPYLGKMRFLTAYLLTGIAASITSLWWHDLTISAGASGAIFGLYGVFLALLTTDLIEKSARKSLLISIAIFVLYNLLYGFSGGIDNAAHIGGLISGIIVGYSFVSSLEENENLKLKMTKVAILSAFFLFISALVYMNIAPYEFAKYDAKMKEFIACESMALEMYKMPQSAPDEIVLHEIKTRSLYYWNENINIINELDLLNLPKPIHERNKKILQYCELRVKNCKLICKSIEENTDKYRADIEEIDKQIEDIIYELTQKK